MNFVPAYAWEIQDNYTGEWKLCRWAHANKIVLASDGKPSPEARIRRVRIMLETEYRALLKEAAP